MQTSTLEIIGMHCTSCALNIDWELEELDGVEESKTNYAEMKTIVVFDPSRVTLEKIIEVISLLKYEVKLL
jgi:Cu+-exporting ATPase